MNRLVAIVGPTAVGKSRLVLRLAQDFNGEIVSADSRQVYRHMDIGTVKPNQQELSLAGQVWPCRCPYVGIPAGYQRLLSLRQSPEPGEEPTGSYPLL